MLIRVLFRSKIESIPFGTPIQQYHQRQYTQCSKYPQEGDKTKGRFRVIYGGIDKAAGTTSGAAAGRSIGTGCAAAYVNNTTLGG